ALARAGTVVCQQFRLDGPADLLGAALGALGRLGAAPEAPEVRGAAYEIRGLLPVARLRELEPAVPGLTRGEGVLETSFHSFRPIS
ncbi:MAG: GTP-binding protein, partial [Actinoplanes sp.]